MLAARRSFFGVKQSAGGHMAAGRWAWAAGAWDTRQRWPPDPGSDSRRRGCSTFSALLYLKWGRAPTSPSTCLPAPARPRCAPPGKQKAPKSMYAPLWLYATPAHAIRDVLHASNYRSRLQFLPPRRDRRSGAVRCGRAIKTIVASGSRPAPETPLKQRAVERTLCSEQSGHAGGWIARCDALICTTDE